MTPDSGAAARRPWLSPRRLAFLLLGLAAFFLIAFLFEGGRIDHGRRPALAAGVAAMMAIWWVGEALPIHITALAPLALFPLLGVFGPSFQEDLRRSALPYIDPYIFLYLGGMGIAAAMQEWNLHSRIALTVLAGIGTRPSRVLLGVLVATASVSLWISNTATATMMLPIGMALIAQMERQAGGGRRERFGGALMLAIAYGANVGGMGTKIGTPPNLWFSGYVSSNMGREVTFLEFLGLGFPLVLALLPVVWGALWLHGRRDAPSAEAGREVVQEKLRELGPMSRGERVVLRVFLAAAALWIASQPLHRALAPLFAEAGFKLQPKHVEAGVALLAMLVLFLWPVRTGAGERRRALSPRSLRFIYWPALVLFGGGFALAEGIEGSGLSLWAGGRLEGLKEASVPIQFLGVCLGSVYFGAIASNVATTAVMMVVLHSVGFAEAVPLMAAATLAASCDFMLPAGTPPNAIVFGSGYLTIPRMARTGFVLDLLAALLVALWGFTGMRWILS